MVKLEIPYSTWKQVAEENSLSSYHIVHSADAVTAWCGTPRMQYHTHVDAEDYEDWSTSFPDSSEVDSGDDAIAHIVGIDNASPPQLVDIAGVPLETDGRMNIVSAPMSQGNYLWITGRLDCPVCGKRGAGRKICARFADGGYSYPITWIDQTNKKFGIAGDHTSEIHGLLCVVLVDGSTGNDEEYSIKSKTYNSSENRTEIETPHDIPSSVVDGNLRFARVASRMIDMIEPTEIQDGQFTWSLNGDWDGEDDFTFCIEFPATPLTAPGAGDYGVIIHEAGIIIPTGGPGTGTYDLVSASAVPVEASMVDGQGMWDYPSKDKWLADPIPAINGPGTGEIHLFPVQVPGIAFMKSLPLSHPMGVLDIDVTKTEYIHKNWEIWLHVMRVSSGAAKAFGWLQFYRRNTGI